MALVEFVSSLARPVARGWLPYEHALASVLAEIARLQRTGELPGTTDYDGAVSFYWGHLFQRALVAETNKRLTVAGAVKDAVRPLLRAHAPKNTILAAAYDANGQKDFALTEVEVEAVVLEEVRWTNIRNRKAARDGR